MAQLLITKFRLKLKKAGKTTRPARYDLNQIPYEYGGKVMSRSKGLDLVNSVPEELRMEVCNIVQEAGNKTIPKKKKSKKAEWSSEEALQTAEERREVKSKGERERHTQPNTEFRRTARRDKKTFFNEQSLKIEPNSRRGKTRDLLRTIGNIKGTFRPQMGAIKDRNGRHLAEDIKKRDGKNTRKNCTKKILMNWITTMVWSVTRARHSEV